MLSEKIRAQEMEELDLSPRWQPWSSIPDEEIYPEVRNEMSSHTRMLARCNHCHSLFRLSWDPYSGRESWEILQGQVTLQALQQ